MRRKRRVFAERCQQKFFIFSLKNCLFKGTKWKYGIFIADFFFQTKHWKSHNLSDCSLNKNWQELSKNEMTFDPSSFFLEIPQFQTINSFFQIFQIQIISFLWNLELSSNQFWGKHSSGISAKVFFLSIFCLNSLQDILSFIQYIHSKALIRFNFWHSISKLFWCWCSFRRNFFIPWIYSQIKFMKAFHSREECEFFFV